MKIEKLQAEELKNEEHYQFQTEFKDLVEEKKPENLHIENEFPAFVDLFNKEGEAIDFMRKSSITELLSEEDKNRDLLFRGIADVVKGYRNHFKPELREMAVKIYNVFKHYGNVAVKAYNEETAAITSLTADLQGQYAGSIAALGLTEWVDALRESNTAFSTLMKDRYSEEASKTPLRMKDIREQIETVYSSIVERINAFIIIEGEEKYKSFVNELNTRIEKYENIVAQRKGRS